MKQSRNQNRTKPEMGRGFHGDKYAEYRPEVKPLTTTQAMCKTQHQKSGLWCGLPLGHDGEHSAQGAGRHWIRWETKRTPQS